MTASPQYPITYTHAYTYPHVYMKIGPSEDRVNMKLGVTVQEYVLTLIFY